MDSDPKHMGKELAAQLLLTMSFRKKGQAKEEAIRSFIVSQTLLKGVAEKYAFVTPMLVAVVKNKLHVLRKVKGKAAELGEEDGRKIGESLARSLAVNTQATAAVDAWIGNFPALKELDDEYDWFRPMIETISYRLLEEVPWGLKMRVTVGAITSMADLLTDIYVTYTFGRDGKGGYFKASLASLITSIWIQMLLVWLQNRKLGMRRVVREWFPILLGYKPAIDAYRVATGAKQEVGQGFDPMFEMTFMKTTEMFAEAIPGVIIQLTAIMTSKGEVGTSAWVSLVISALTTGFASATVSYDFDTDPVRRMTTPDFYGFIPTTASKRSLVFVVMVLISAGMLLIRCTTIVVLGMGGTNWVATYIGADLGIYLAVKVLRGDFWYWFSVGGALEIPISILARVYVKVNTDFTSLVQNRHPNEVGGISWMFGFILTMGSLPLAITLAESDIKDRDFSLAWNIAKYFLPSSIVCFAVFFFNIERKYWHTFWSATRGKDMTMAYFLEGKSDAVKFEVMGNSRHHWVSIEEKVKKWVGENWARWEEEKPEWFTDAMKAKVPVEFIPTSGEARRRESMRRASEDAVAEEVLGGALRASIRRASIGSVVARVLPIEEDN
jgi:hypothetical protein